MDLLGLGLRQEPASGGTVNLWGRDLGQASYFFFVVGRGLQPNDEMPKKRDSGMEAVVKRLPELNIG